MSPPVFTSAVPVADIFWAAQINHLPPRGGTGKAKSICSIILVAQALGAPAVFRYERGPLMAKMHKIMSAGPLIKEAYYPRINPSDGQTVRAAKKKISSEALKRMNNMYAYEKLEFKIAANFGDGDLFVTLTYDDAHLPINSKVAAAKWKSFVSQLRQVRRDSELDLRYLYRTENKHGAGRWHHHAIINAIGSDFELIQSLWPYGQVKCTTLTFDREQTYQRLAMYLVKEQRDRVGQRLWSGSRNLRKTSVETEVIGNDVDIEAPAKALVLEDTGPVQTAYGCHRYIKYMCKPQKQSRIRAKHRKRSRMVS